MVLITSNKIRRLLYVGYSGRVHPADFTRQQPDLEALMAELSPGFRVLVNLSELETMDLECMTEIGRIMELIDRSGVGLIVRVIPDPAKDIGLNIFSIFHYPHHPQIATCKSMTEAGELLGL
jgi:hypothetical protein